MVISQETVSSLVGLSGWVAGGWQYCLGRLVLLPLLFALTVLVAWELFCRASRISPLLLPPPSAVWSVLSENWGILFQQSVPTTLETTSFAVATLLGVALAVAITFSVWVREALYPNIVMFQLIPKIAIAFGLVALGEIAVQRWYGGEMPVGGVI
jgi:ABC-type nitrate/sulfonate/bicarbonate transport system permease component